MPHAVIVGAGISGVIAAQRLRKAQWQVTLLEKSSACGGRMATRHFGEGLFDYGAQFFTMHSMFFRVLTEELQDEGIVKAWSRGFLNGERQLALDGYLRFYGVKGIKSIVQHLAQDLDIRCNEKVIGFSAVNQQWHIQCESGLQLGSDALILTAPLPQSMQLLNQANGLEISPEQQECLNSVKYDPCFALMVNLDGPSTLPEPGGMAQTDPMSPIQWIADNQQKGIAEQPCVTIHATAHFSRQHWKQDRESTAEKLWEAAKPWIGAEKASMVLHAWRFAQAKTVLDRKHACIQLDPPLYLAGDAFGDRINPIEGAVLSGLEVAKSLI